MPVRRGRCVCLGGSGNETDHSARITAQIGLACQPGFLLSKPGFGGEEALMIQTNERLRTLVLIENSRRANGPSAQESSTPL
jgi:methylaspartate ammonia-lyase